VVVVVVVATMVLEPTGMMSSEAVGMSVADAALVHTCSLLMEAGQLVDHCYY
jgi:hypothetical protein